MSERIRVLEQRCLNAETARLETIRLARCSFNHFEKEKQRLERLLQERFNHFEKMNDKYIAEGGQLISTDRIGTAALASSRSPQLPATASIMYYFCYEYGHSYDQYYIHVMYHFYVLYNICIVVWLLSLPSLRSANDRSEVLKKANSTRKAQLSLREYCVIVYKTLREEKLKGKFEAGDIDKMEKAVEQALEWQGGSWTPDAKHFMAKEEELRATMHICILKVFESIDNFWIHGKLRSAKNAHVLQLMMEHSGPTCEKPDANNVAVPSASASSSASSEGSQEQRNVNRPICAVIDRRQILEPYHACVSFSSHGISHNHNFVHDSQKKARMIE